MRCTLMNIAVFLAMTLFMASCFANGASVQPSAKVSSAAYTVPQNGTPAQYMAFIEKLSNVKRPDNQSKKEAVAQITELCKARIAAADKVIEHKDATSEQIQRAASVKVKSLQILVKLGSKKAKALIDAMPAELKKADQPKMADDISMGLINLKFKEAKKTNDFSEIEKISANTTEAIKKTPADNKAKLQRLYQIKLICSKELGQLKGVDNSADFNALASDVKAAGLTEMAEDVILSKLINALSVSTAKNDKAMFDRTARAVDSMIASYGAKANSKVAAVAFRTAHAEEVFDSVAAAARYTKYVNNFFRFKDAKVQEIVKKMQGAAKRLALKGKPLPITGKTVDGKQFNMANLKNKNVLVFPWSPSDRASVEKLNYLRRAYPAYKAKGFEVVGVAMDPNPHRAAAMARRYNLPWANMSYRDAYVGSVPFWLNYGFGELSRMIMLNRHGLVSSANLNYRSLVNELDREYGRLTKEQIDAFKDISFDEFDKFYDNYYDLDDLYDLDSFDDYASEFDDDFYDDFYDDIDDFDDIDIDDIDNVDDIDDIDDIDDVDDDIDNIDDIDDVDDNIDSIDDIDDVNDDIDNNVDDVDNVDDDIDDNVDDVDEVDDGGDYDDGGYDDADVDDGGDYDGGDYDDGGYDDGGYDDF